MKTRLLFLISRFLDGGIDTILTEYLRNIPLDRYDVTLAIGTAMGDLEVHRSRLPEGVRVEYLVDATALTHWRKEKIRRRIPAAAKIYDELILNPIRTAVAHRRLKRLISQADAVIDFDATFYTMLRSCRVPVIGFYHFSIEENLRRSRRHTLRQMHGMANYVHIALISNVMVEEGKRLFPELASRFTRIYNGYNFADLRRRGEAETVVEVRKPYFVAVERLEESQKDVSTLLRAYAKARTESDGPFPGLVVVGAGRDEAMLHHLASDLHIEDATVFTGFQSDAAPYISRAEALVLASKYEGFGLVLVEAMVLGRPVVASDCPSGPAEVLDGGRAGILVPVGDVDALASALSQLAADPAMRERLAAASAERAKAFDIHESVTQLLELCRPSR